MGQLRALRGVGPNGPIGGLGFVEICWRNTVKIVEIKFISGHYRMVPGFFQEKIDSGL